MHKLILSILMSLLLVSCSSCFRRYPDPSGRDAREMMSQTVKIDVTVHGMSLSLDKDGNVIKKEDKAEWTGSGVVVVVDHDSNLSLVLSADHVVDIPKLIEMEDEEGNPKLFFSKSAVITVERLNGSTCNAIPAEMDPDNDIGTIVTDCIAGEAVVIADSLPPVGSIVTASGAPLGIHPAGVFIVTDGRYVGLEENGKVVVTLATTFGGSGGGIFYRGKLFGIVTNKAGRFEHANTGTSLDPIKKIVKSVLDKANAN